MASAINRSSNRRDQVMVGELSPDFLRIVPSGLQSPQMTDGFVVQQMQPKYGGFSAIIGRLSITIVQAKLTKNYGITRMDPYCRLRVGHMVFETPTSFSGSKNPRWNKTFVCNLPKGVDSFYVEIYDEKTFSVDDRVAWTHMHIPPSVFEGDTVDDWFPLNGRQGEEREGLLNVVISHQVVQQAPQMQPQQPIVYQTDRHGNLFMPGSGMVYYPPPSSTMNGHNIIQPAYMYDQQHCQPVVNTPSEADVAMVKELFPTLEVDVVRSVLEEKNCDKEAAITALLAMTQDS